MKNFDRIEGYLKNEMSAEARSQFEKELKSNEELREEFQIQKLEHETLDQLSEEFLLNEIKSIRSDQSNKGQGLSMWKNVRTWIPLAIAASVALFFGIKSLSPSSGSTYSSFALEYYDSYSPNFSLSRKMEDSQSNWKKFMSALESNRKEDIEAYLNNSKIDHSELSPDKQFYLAHAKFKLGQYDASSKAFDQLIQRGNLDTQKQEMCEFYLALSLLLEEKKHDATQQLNTISKQDGHSFQAIASEMLTKMP